MKEPNEERRILSAVELANRGDQLICIGNEIRDAVRLFSEKQGLLRASMHNVAKLLLQSAASIEQLANSMRYDEPRGVRCALDVHALLLGDLANELEHPGETKYSPNSASAVIIGEVKP